MRMALTGGFSSVQSLSLTLCDPMDCSTLGFPIHNQRPELAQTHVHRVGDASQPSHPLSSPSFLPSIFPSIRVFSSELALCNRWPKYWSFGFSISPSSEYSGLISFRMDRLDLLAVQETPDLSTNLTNSHVHIVAPGRKDPTAQAPYTALSVSFLRTT